MLWEKNLEICLAFIRIGVYELKNKGFDVKIIEPSLFKISVYNYEYIHMNFSVKIFETLQQNALLVDAGRLAKLSAAIVQKNRIISVGQNSYKSHPFQKRFGKTTDSIFLHAETSAIVKAIKELDTTDLSNCDLYICRMKRCSRNLNDIYGLAKPCIGCARAITEFGIRNVFYTTNEESITCL